MPRFHNELLLFILANIIHNSLGRQATGDHGSRHARSATCAGAGEIQIVIAGMTIGWAEVAAQGDRGVGEVG